MFWPFQVTTAATPPVEAAITVEEGWAPAAGWANAPEEPRPATTNSTKRDTLNHRPGCDATAIGEGRTGCSLIDPPRCEPRPTPEPPPGAAAALRPTSFGGLRQPASLPPWSGAPGRSECRTCTRTRGTDRPRSGAGAGGGSRGSRTPSSSRVLPSQSSASVNGTEDIRTARVAYAPRGAKLGEVRKVASDLYSGSRAAGRGDGSTRAEPYVKWILITTPRPATEKVPCDGIAKPVPVATRKE
jgi:hypothetical protein